MKTMEFGEYSGKKVFYFHGVPGAVNEGALFEKFAKQHQLNIICMNRFSLHPALTGQQYYQQLASFMSQTAGGQSVDIIGFSMGCQVAIETSLLLGGKVNNLHLISAAAPLEAGDFLDDMAGKPVFTLAQKLPAVFFLLTHWQSFLAKLSPSLLFNMLFASAQGEDKNLVKDEKFKQFITPILKDCFNGHVKGYLREIKQYVAPWQDSVPKCSTNTTVWHGEEDNWSPPAMAHYLKQALPNCQKLELMAGLSHYSCLQAASEKICRQLAQGDEQPLNG